MRLLTIMLIATLCLAGASACGEPPPKLHQAILDQDAKRVARLLESGADADRRWRYTQSGHSGATFEFSPLELAVVRTDQDIIRALAQHADIYAENDNNMTAFEWAIRFDHPENAKLLWMLSDRETYRQHASNALRLASDKRKDPAVFQWLLDEVATNESIGELFAYWAAWGAKGRDDGLRYIQELLERGLEPSSRALAAAVRHRNLGTTRLLLNRGLPIDGDGGEYPPLHYAFFSSWDLSVAEFLLERGADPNKLDAWGRTPAMTVIRVRYFVANRTTDQLRDDFAAQALAPLRLLMSYGADLSIADPEGRAIVDYVDATKDPDYEYSKERLRELISAAALAPAVSSAGTGKVGVHQEEGSKLRHIAETSSFTDCFVLPLWYGVPARHRLL
jgi:ankyrin repeat protein